MIRKGQITLATHEDPDKPETERVRVVLMQAGQIVETGISGSTVEAAMKSLASFLTMPKPANLQ